MSEAYVTREQFEALLAEVVALRRENAALRAEVADLKAQLAVAKQTRATRRSLPRPSIRTRNRPPNHT